MVKTDAGLVRRFLLATYLCGYDNIMLKILAGFIIFAVISMFFLYKNADKIDIQGESHNVVPESTTPAAVTPK